MKTLTDLAREWQENIKLTYIYVNDEWAAEFLDAHMCCHSPRADGKTPNEALKNLAKKIRGHRLVFKDKPFIHFTVPEVITA